MTKHPASLRGMGQKSHCYGALSSSSEMGKGVGVVVYGGSGSKSKSKAKNSRF